MLPNKFYLIYYRDMERIINLVIQMWIIALSLIMSAIVLAVVFVIYTITWYYVRSKEFGSVYGSIHKLYRKWNQQKKRRILQSMLLIEKENK